VRSFNDDGGWSKFGVTPSGGWPVGILLKSTPAGSFTEAILDDLQDRMNIQIQQQHPLGVVGKGRSMG
jgi:hypothetical protein